jgi:hypothetical protein
MADQYKRMSKASVVRRAAGQAGGALNKNMQNLVKGEPSLSQHRNVGEAFRVFHTKDNVNVGLPEDHPLIDQARKMDQDYQVSQVAFELSQQSGEIEQLFHAALGSGSRSWWQRLLGMSGALR